MSFCVTYHTVLSIEPLCPGLWITPWETDVVSWRPDRGLANEKAGRRGAGDSKRKRRPGETHHRQENQKHIRRIIII